MKTVIVSIILVGVAVVLLDVKVLFVKGATFPSGHIGRSKAMSERGIHCATHHDNRKN